MQGTVHTACTFCDWLLSPSILSPRFSHVLAHAVHSFQCQITTLCVCGTFCLSSRQLMDMVYFYFLALVSNAAINKIVHFWFGHVFSVLLGVT